MHIQVLKEDLSNALNTAIRFTSTRATLPILGNFLLRAEKTKLIIEATNLEMSVSISIGAKIEKEGTVAVPSKIFQELISNLNSGQVTITLEKEELQISSGSFKSKILIAPANDFPSVPKELDPKNSFTLPASILLDGLTKVLFSASSDDSRPILKGILFVFNENELTLVSSDGFRLTKTTLKIESDLKIKNIVIPKSSILELIKNTNEEKITFELKDKDNQLLISIGNICLSTRLVEGNFPDYEKIIPAGSSTKISLDRKELLQSVKLASVFARESDNLIKLKINEGSLQITSESSKSGNQSQSIEIKMEGSPVDILFNYKFIEEFANIARGDTLEIKLTDAISPVIFEDKSDTNFLHVIMPVRVQS